MNIYRKESYMWITEIPIEKGSSRGKIYGDGMCVISMLPL